MNRDFSNFKLVCLDLCGLFTTHIDKVQWEKLDAYKIKT